MARNVASGNDRVAVQVGRVVAADERPKDEPARTKPPAGTGGGKTKNVVEGNAKVGRQEDVIKGGLNICW
jgi:hypothetical protein